MKKFVSIKLLAVEYRGDSVGDDIEISITYQERTSFFKKQIRNGSMISLNFLLGHFSLEPKEIPLVIKVEEKDLVFNDIGIQDFPINIASDDYKPQRKDCKVSVKESRGLFSKGEKVAEFVFSFEFNVTDGLCYIPLVKGGWMVCRKADTGEKVSLPSYLQVLFLDTKEQRDYFSPQEGIYSGIEMSMESSNGISFLQREDMRLKGVALTYSVSQKKLYFEDKNYEAVDSIEYKWELGSYDIEIPDYPHRGGLNYKTSEYATLWFRIGQEGDRYIHIGRYSLGCITLTEAGRWDGLCSRLLKARKGDGKSIGTLTVIK